MEPDQGVAAGRQRSNRDGFADAADPAAGYETVVRAYLTQLVGPDRAAGAADRVIAEIAATNGTARDPRPDVNVVRKLTQRAGLEALEAEVGGLATRIARTAVGRRQCSSVARRLRSRADGQMTAGELDRFYRHLERCQTCAGLAGRFEASEWFLLVELGSTKPKAAVAAPAPVRSAPAPPPPARPPARRRKSQPDETDAVEPPQAAADPPVVAEPPQAAADPPVVAEPPQAAADPPVVAEPPQAAADPPALAEPRPVAESPVVADESDVAVDPVAVEESDAAAEPVGVDESESVGEPAVADESDLAVEPVAAHDSDLAVEPVSADESDLAVEPVVADESESAGEPETVDELTATASVNGTGHHGTPDTADRTEQHESVADAGRPADAAASPPPAIEGRPKRSKRSTSREPAEPPVAKPVAAGSKRGGAVGGGAWPDRVLTPPDWAGGDSPAGASADNAVAGKPSGRPVKAVSSTAGGSPPGRPATTRGQSPGLEPPPAFRETPRRGGRRPPAGLPPAGLPPAGPRLIGGTAGGSWRRSRLVIVGAVVVLAGAAAAVIVSRSGGTKSGAGRPGPIAPLERTTTDRTPTTTKPPVTPPAPVAAVLNRTVGRAFVLAGASFTVFANPVGAWTTFARTVSAGPGRKWTLVSIEVRNISHTGFDPRVLHYRLMAASGANYFPYGTRGTTPDVGKPPHPLAAGGFAEVQLAFRVPASAGALKLAFDPTGKHERVVVALGR